MSDFLVTEDFVKSVAVLKHMEKLRVSAQNTLWSLTEYPEKKEWGMHLPEMDPNVIFMSDTVAQMKDAEAQLEAEILDEFKSTELYTWSAQFKGMKGGKLVARLLGTIGDPYKIMSPYDDFGKVRTYPMLESYVGMSVVNGKAPTLAKKTQAAYKPESRVRLWNISDQFLRQRTPEFRPVYDLTKEKYTGTVGADGKELTKGHVHKRAMRAMSKSFLKALYNEAKRLHN